VKRSLYKELLNWKNDPFRRPLILRGARQVGKTYLVQEFGKEAFESFAEVNFEYFPEFKTCFKNLNPKLIIEKLETYLNINIESGKTLLFLDEIQEHPQAILALRYFKEKMPDLHIIAAGSLLEFTLEEEEFSFPVGRVQFLYLSPLSFYEFLKALGEEKLIKKLENMHIGDVIDDALHEHLMNFVRSYFITGGMPEALAIYKNEKSLLRCRQFQRTLLQTYQKDFGKYAKKTQIKHLQRLYNKAPSLVAKHFKYVHVDPDARTKDIKLALEQLQYAGIITPIYATAASGLPLRAQINEKKYKLLFLDIGLMQAAVGLDPKLVWENDLLNLLSGAVTEQFVGQELIAYGSSFEEKHLYFWERAKKSSSAEVDYVANFDGQIVPIEVKSGKAGKLKSLQQFMKEKNSLLGVKISAQALEIDRGILSVPFYLIHQLARLLKETHTC
jgi:predicted AAA+ superfamily ATPase